MKKPTSLKQAQADPKAMKQFIEEHADLEVEGERFEGVLSSMVGKSKKKTDDDSDGLTQL